MRLVLEIEIFIKIILIGKNEKGRKCIRLILLLENKIFMNVILEFYLERNM